MRRTLVAAAAIALVPPAAFGQTSGSDSQATIPCTQNPGQPFVECVADAVREGREVEVIVTFPNGFRRSLYFADGRFLKANATMSGVGKDTEWSVAEGIYAIRVDDQRFEVPEHLVR